jgi:hypothetical protein
MQVQLELPQFPVRLGWETPLSDEDFERAAMEFRSELLNDSSLSSFGPFRSQSHRDRTFGRICCSLCRNRFKLDARH